VSGVHLETMNGATSMTTTRRPDRAARGGTTVVEMAVVLSALMLFLFSIFEYGRYVMVENLLINAVRDGCRYALVHCQDTTVVADTQAVVIQKMAGLNGQLTGFTVTVYPTDNPAAALNSINPDDPITVQATGTFRALFPQMPYMPTTFTMRSASVMTCEGN
jgi:Flp pilus assembly protein TadG